MAWGGGVAAAISIIIQKQNREMDELREKLRLQCPRCSSHKIEVLEIHYVCRDCGAFIDKNTRQLVNRLRDGEKDA